MTRRRELNAGWEVRRGASSGDPSSESISIAVSSGSATEAEDAASLSAGCLGLDLEDW
jgi:hypothetical protein